MDLDDSTENGKHVQNMVGRIYVISKLRRSLNSSLFNKRSEALKQSNTRSFCHSSTPTFRTKPSLGMTGSYQAQKDT